MSMSGIRKDKWEQRWAVRSSSGHGDYIVGRDKDGNFGCSCMGWTMNVVKMCSKCGMYWGKGEVKCSACGSTEHTTMRRDCSHIAWVKCGKGMTIAEETLNKMLGR